MPKNEPELLKLSELEQRIVQELQHKQMEIDLLSRSLRIPFIEIGTVIYLMRLKGFIFIENWKYYVI